MARPKVLIQLDTDRFPSSFDAVVAIDAGVDHLLSYGGVAGEEATSLVHGAMFTRGGDDLASTAIFVGGSSVEAAEAVAEAVEKTFFGPVRVSWMLDPNGANTTAAAAVALASVEIDPAGSRWVILGATGPVGQRVTRLAARLGAELVVASRRQDRGEQVAKRIKAQYAQAKIEVAQTDDDTKALAIARTADVLVAAGAAGVQLLPDHSWQDSPHLRLAIDLNAVAPFGIPGIEPADRGQRRGRCVCYGALGIGGTKMKIHRRAIARLFEANHYKLDAEEIYEIAKQVVWASRRADAPPCGECGAMIVKQRVGICNSSMRNHMASRYGTSVTIRRTVPNRATLFDLCGSLNLLRQNPSDQQQDHRTNENQRRGAPRASALTQVSGYCTRRVVCGDGGMDDGQRITGLTRWIVLTLVAGLLARAWTPTVCIILQCFIGDDESWWQECGEFEFSD